MKMNLWERLLLLAGAIIATITGVLMVFFGFRAFGTIPLWMQTPCVMLGFLTAVFGGTLIYFLRKICFDKHDFVVQHTDNGELRIAVAAIENLVQKCIDLHEEIHVVSTKIRNSRDGVTVELCVSLASNIAIPLAVASLQKQIRQYLAASSGIEVREVCVSVETTEQEMASAPSAEVPEMSNVIAEKFKSSKTKEKIPLHLRLFRKGDQAVTVPEPPKVEETADASQENGQGKEAFIPAESLEKTPINEDAHPAQSPESEEEEASHE